MSNIKETQMPKALISLIDQEIDYYGQRRSITVRNDIPETTAIPLDNPLYWFRIPDVICVFVDMIGSTKLSAKHHENSTAGVYRLFTETAIQIFHHFEAPYIDVKGDGAFALFNQDQAYRALVSAVSFKTFADAEFAPRIQQTTGLDIGAHIGIDQKTVLVRRFGLRRVDGRTDRQNEVWAGKPVNMAAKLASLTQGGELLVSDRYYERLTDRHATHSCDCGSGGQQALWEEEDMTPEKLRLGFDFDRAYRLKSKWCETHGAEYARELLACDGK